MSTNLGVAVRVLSSWNASTHPADVPDTNFTSCQPTYAGNPPWVVTDTSFEEEDTAEASCRDANGNYAIGRCVRASPAHKHLKRLLCT